jgi:hypothetical protein
VALQVHTNVSEEHTVSIFRDDYISSLLTLKLIKCRGWVVITTNSNPKSNPSTTPAIWTSIIRVFLQSLYGNVTIVLQITLRPSLLTQ